MPDPNKFRTSGRYARAPRRGARDPARIATRPLGPFRRPRSGSSGAVPTIAAWRSRCCRSACPRPMEELRDGVIERLGEAAEDGVGYGWDADEPLPAEELWRMEMVLGFMSRRSVSLRRGRCGRGCSRGSGRGGVSPPPPRPPLPPPPGRPPPRGLLAGARPPPPLRVPETRFGLSERALAGSSGAHLMLLLAVSTPPRAGGVALPVRGRERGRDTRLASRARGASPAGGPAELSSSRSGVPGRIGPDASS